MRISDWSSDVCSSDLQSPSPDPVAPAQASSAPEAGGGGEKEPASPEQVWEAFEQQCRDAAEANGLTGPQRSEEHTSELQSLMRISYAVFCLKKQKNKTSITYQLTRHTPHN